MTYDKLSEVMGEKVYTVPETAQVLNSCEQMVGRWIRAGEMSAIRVGKRYGVRESALRDFLNSRTTQTKHS